MLKSHTNETRVTSHPAWDIILGSAFSVYRKVQMTDSVDSSTGVLIRPMYENEIHPFYESQMC